MKFQFYLLGFLARFGPLHGYKLKQLISKQVSDFAQIKMPSIYYHLDSLEKKGFVDSKREQEGKRPERTVYSITESGKDKLKKLFFKILKQEYRPEFLIDGTLFFNEIADPKALTAALQAQLVSVEESLDYIHAHQKEVHQNVPEEFLKISGLIFLHHQMHFETEKKWLKKVIEALKN